MALIVADGTTNLATAEAYVSVDYVTTYAEEHNLDWDHSDTDEAEGAIRRGTVWLDARYRKRFTGIKVERRSQLLEWPRSGAYDRNGDYVDYLSIPREVQQATAEAAIRELADPGVLSPDITAGSIPKRVKVDVIEVEFANVEGTVAEQEPISTTIDDIMGNLLYGVGISRLAGKSLRC